MKKKKIRKQTPKSYLEGDLIFLLVVSAQSFPLINIDTINGGTLMSVYGRHRVINDYIACFPGVFVAHTAVVHKRVYDIEDGVIVVVNLKSRGVIPCLLVS